MSIYDDTAQADLAGRAVRAYHDGKAAAAKRQAYSADSDFARIGYELAIADIIPASTRPVRNRRDQELCVLVVERVDTRAIEDDGTIAGVFQPAVAAAIRNGDVWILAEDIDGESETAGSFLPVAPLTGLDTIGKALTEGGREIVAPLKPYQASINAACHELERAGWQETPEGAQFCAFRAVTYAIVAVAEAIAEGGSAA